MPHKALFFHIEHAGEGGREYLMKNDALRGAGVEVAFADAPLDKDHVPAETDFDIAGVFVESKVDAETIGKLPSVKFITTLSTGYDHIDRAVVAARGIPVSYVPSYGENTVAEFAFALILALTRKLIQADRMVRDEGKFSNDGLAGTDLAGKTIGIVGTGRIGKHAVRMAKGFGMNIVAYDVIKDEAFAKEMGFPYLSLDELLAQSDIVTLHVPYLPQTHHLINAENIGRMKKGAYLINTARGAVVETPALVSALKGGAIAGAGLDVMEEENAMRGGDMSIAKELAAMPNVIVTPHNAFNTKEAFERILAVTVENILNFVKGTPGNLVK